MGKIGIYGGSFNPIHNGHLHAIQAARTELQLDEILLIPAGTPPHKTLPEMTPSAETRLSLVRIAASDLPFVRVDDREVRKEGKCYSVDTVRELKAEHPDDTLYLIVGTDMFLSFPTWYRYEEILSMADLCAVRRYDSEVFYLPKIREMEARLCASFPGKVHILTSNNLDVSSTAARRMLFFGCGEEHVPPKVLRAIREQGLYASGVCKDLSYEELCRKVRPLYESRRYQHAQGCADTAKKLALRFGADPSAAERAGILHDMTKALTKKEQEILCRRFGLKISDACVRDVLHGFTAAAAAETIFGESEAVASSIRWHTTGKADMTKLEKILYLADYIEPNRTIPEVKRLRELAERDLDAAVLLGLEFSIADLLSRGKTLDPNSAEAYAFLKAGRNER